MTEEHVLLYPDPRLRQKVEEVGALTNDEKGRVFRMLRLLYEQMGIGLAAPQIGWMKRLIVINVHPTHDPRHSMAVVNPRISEESQKKWTMREGCLSFPGIYGSVERPWAVKIEGQNLEGENMVFPVSGLAARCILHEVDHLDGVLFIDRMSAATMVAIRPKLKRLEQHFKRRGQA